MAVGALNHKIVLQVELLWYESFTHEAHHLPQVPRIKVGFRVSHVFEGGDRRQIEWPKIISDWSACAMDPVNKVST